MTTLLGCIADDVTGASDLAGLLARSGIKVSLRFGTPTAEPKGTAAIEIIALKCRTIAVDDAVAQCSKALKWLQDAGASRFYWKYCSTFDSTAKGNIGPVAKALMQLLDSNQTIYCPAFPENGRTVKSGDLYVNEIPLAESPMKDHPLTPMTDSNLMRLLKPQVANDNVGHIDLSSITKGRNTIKAKLNELVDENIQHVITDAVTDEDLVALAKACVDMPLLTGGSALAMFLPELYVANKLIKAKDHQMQIPTVDKKAILLAGSCSAKTQLQVANYTKLAPCLKINSSEIHQNGSNEVLAWYDEHKEENPLIYATTTANEITTIQNLIGKDEASKLVEVTLAKLANHAFANGIRSFVIAGGETSGSVANALAVNQMTIGKEIAPGVPWTYAISNNETIALTMKSGNFGGDNFFTDALNLL